MNNKLKEKLLKAVLPHVVMNLLEEEPMHGYQIINTIRKRHGIYFGASTIYPLLQKLEKKGLVQSTWDLSTDRPRKPYTLTKLGQATLEKQEVVIAAELHQIIS